MDAIIATSASGLPLGQITEKAVHPERCVGGHPYNPPHLIPLVEITKTEKTDPANVELAKEFYQALARSPSFCTRTARAISATVCSWLSSARWSTWSSAVSAPLRMPTRL